MQEIKKDVYRIEEGKNQYLKKFKNGWTIISPIKKDITKGYSWDNIDWFNLVTGGSIANLAKTLLIIFLIVGISWSYASETRVCREMMGDPVAACRNAGYYGFNDINRGEEKEDENEPRLYIPSTAEGYDPPRC